MTGRQDVTIENINVVGNIIFPGDTAVLRLGGGVAGLEDVTVPSGNAEIVIEKGAEIPKTFTGGGGNLNASIYCNHDSADFSSKITQGASAFKVWFPIELGGIALPTDGENDTNVTQRTVQPTDCTAMEVRRTRKLRSRVRSALMSLMAAMQ